MEIAINDYRFNVVFADGNTTKLNPEGSTYLGLTEFITPTITIRRGLTKPMFRSTVIHELVHAFIFAYGYHADYDEEALCDFFGSQADRIMSLTTAIMERAGVENAYTD